MGAELSQLDTVQMQWDWLLKHLRVYLIRMQHLCNELKISSAELVPSSLSCNISVAANHIELILAERNLATPEWREFRSSLDRLAEDNSIACSLAYLDTFEKSVFKADR